VRQTVQKIRNNTHFQKFMEVALATSNFLCNPPELASGMEIQSVLKVKIRKG
jgi:hypothetical protein